MLRRTSSKSKNLNIYENHTNEDLDMNSYTSQNLLNKSDIKENREIQKNNKWKNKS